MIRAASRNTMLIPSKEEWEWIYGCATSKFS